MGKLVIVTQLSITSMAQSIMKRTCTISGIILLLALILASCNTQSSEQKAPQEHWYDELPNPTPTDPAKWEPLTSPLVSWGTRDKRYPKEEPFAGDITNQIKLVGWRGEFLSAQLLISTPQQLDKVRVEWSELTSKEGGTIGREQFFGGFVRYVMTDELNRDGKGGCGHRPDASQYDSLLVADPIDHLITFLPMQERTTTGYWLRIELPSSALPGMYQGEVKVLNGTELLETLQLSIEVQAPLLPPVRERTFRLDLWQNPFAIARYHQVEPWTPEHFEAMKPYMQLYQSAGGNTITATITHKPWNGQTYDHFDSMIRWIKGNDGNWRFDYTIFDQWVSFMLEIGVDKQIDCYSMVPWQLSFLYYDEASDQEMMIETQPGEEAYTEMWSAFLRSFSQHLREKGWFDFTHIAMDERPEEVMTEVLQLIRTTDPEYKVSLAGFFHEALIPELNYYSPPLRSPFTEEQLASRKAKGYISTFYTSCEEPRPNTFTFCDPADTAWFGWYAARRGLDGYLRWALNSWVANPLQDSRFTTWAAGDTYLIYPGPRTSIRYERLREGIEDYTKVQVLRAMLQERGDEAELARLQEVLDTIVFDPEMMLKEHPTSATVNAGQHYLAEVSRTLPTE